MKCDVQCIERPSGATCAFEEFRRRHSLLVGHLNYMHLVAEEMASNDDLTGTIIICRMTGLARESSIRFEYPENEDIEKKLNCIFKERLMRDWATGKLGK